MIILFTILKLIGILALVLAVVLAAVLFFPVSYLFDADIDNGDYQFRINWLFRIVRFRFRYREKAEAVLRILFVKTDFMDPEKKEKRARRKAKKAERKKKKLERKRRKDRSAIDLDPDGEVPCPAGEDGQAAARTAEDAEQKDGTGLLQSIKKIFHILRSVYENRVFGSVFPGLQVLLMRIRPRQLSGRVEFGFADPSVTGEVLGAVAMVPFLLGTELAICPDFDTEKTYAGGKVHIRGRMFVIHPLIFLIRMIADKNVRAFLGTLRRKKK